MPIVSIGADYSHARPNQAFFTRHGLTFACRYLLDDARDGGKALKRPEALQLSSWGIGICSNFEYAIGGMLRGYNQGVADARVALAELRAIGAPRDVVYFSCDTDVSISQIPAVLEYMRGAASQLGKENVGVYGEYDLIGAAHKAGYRWLWQCYAWSRGLWSAHATVRQVHNGAFPGEYDADLNHAMTADIGQWTLGGDDGMLTTEEHNALMQINMLLHDGLRLGNSQTGPPESRPHAWIVRVFKELGVDVAAIAADVDTLEESDAGILAAVRAIPSGGGGDVDTEAVVNELLAKLPPAVLDLLSARLRPTG